MSSYRITNVYCNRQDSLGYAITENYIQFSMLMTLNVIFPPSQNIFNSGHAAH